MRIQFALWMRLLHMDKKCMWEEESESEKKKRKETQEHRIWSRDRPYKIFGLQWHYQWRQLVPLILLLKIFYKVNRYRFFGISVFMYPAAPYYMLNSESTTKTHGQSERGIKSMLYVKLPPTNKYTLTMGIQEILHFSLKIFFHFFFAHTHQDRKKKSFLCEISTAFLFRKKEYLKSAQKWYKNVTEDMI